MPVGEGGFVWYELMTSNAAAAQDFYTGVASWTAVTSGVPARYTLLKVGERQAAGVMEIPSGAEGWRRRDASIRCRSRRAWRHRLARTPHPRLAAGVCLLPRPVRVGKVSRHRYGANRTYQTLTIDGVRAGGMFNSAQAWAPFWLYYFNVENIDAAAARVTAAGGQLVQARTRFPAAAGSFKPSIARARCSRS